MLKIKTITKDILPVKEIIEVRGEAITFMLRPWAAEIAKKIRQRHIRGFEYVIDSRGRRDKVELLDDNAFFDEMLDYIIAEFEGVGDEAGNPWPVDLEHKKMVIAIAVEKGAQPLWERILERSQALAFVQAEDEAGQEKN